MINAGDSIENPVTGERIVFRQTSGETNGEAVVVECFVKPDGAVAAAHVHPCRTSASRCSRDGSASARRQEIEAGPAQRVTRPGRHAPSVLERRRRRGALRLRGPPGAQVRAAARDDVRARRRRQDEPARACRTRCGWPSSPAQHFDDRAAAVPARVDAAARARPRRPGRPAARLPARLRPGPAGGGGDRMRRRLRRRLVWSVVFVGLTLLWLTAQVLRAADAIARRRGALRSRLA